MQCDSVRGTGDSESVGHTSAVYAYARVEEDSIRSRKSSYLTWKHMGELLGYLPEKLFFHSVKLVLGEG